MSKIVKFFDIPSSSIMGFTTISIIIFCYASVFFKVDIPATVVTIYGMILGAFAASKTIKAFA